MLQVVYGGAYSKAAVPFTMLFTIAMVRMLSVPVISSYYMIARPELNRRFTVVRTVLMIALVYPATKWYGLAGAAGAGLIAMTLHMYYRFSDARHHWS